MDDERWRGLRTLFDGVAERYDAARPRYPRAVVDDLVALAELGSGSRRTSTRSWTARRRSGPCRAAGTSST